MKQQKVVEILCCVFLSAARNKHCSHSGDTVITSPQWRPLPLRAQAFVDIFPWVTCIVRGWFRSTQHGIGCRYVSMGSVNCESIAHIDSARHRLSVHAFFK